jgi:GAF domain-containing protein
MSDVNYLSPFVEVSRALSDGADCYSVLNLIARRVTESFGLKGCLIKIKGQEGERLEMVSSYGLSEHFLFSDRQNAPGCLFSTLPESVVSVPRFGEGEYTAEQELMMLEEIQALAVVPIELEQEVFGMVALFAAAPRELTKNDLSFVQAITAPGMLLALWARRLESSIERERQYLRTFQEVSSTINASLDIKEVLELVVTKVTAALDGKGCIVRLLDRKGETLELEKAHGLSKEFINKGPVDPRKHIPENLEGKTVIIDNVFTDPRLQYPRHIVAEGIRKILSIPLMVRGKVIGVLRVFTEERPPFTKREINFATALAQQCAFAIENARLYERLRMGYEKLLVDFGYSGSSS